MYMETAESGRLNIDNVPEITTERFEALLPFAVALGAATFIVTSPFVLVEPGKAFHDAWDTQNLHHTGWLGFEHDGTSLEGYLHQTNEMGTLGLDRRESACTAYGG